MYILDAECWDGPFDRAFWKSELLQKLKPLNNLRRASIVAAAGFFVSGIVFRVEQYTYGPLCCFLVLLVGYVIGIKILFLGNTLDTRQYVGSLSIPLLITATWVFIWWVVWTNQSADLSNGGYRIWSPTVEPVDVGWSDTTKRHYARDMGCTPDYDDDKVDDPYPTCLGAFLLWSAPAVIAFAFCIFALTAYVLDPNDNHGAPKMIGQFILVLLFGMWCSASISGAGSVITTAVFAFVLAGLAAVCGFSVYAYGKEMFQAPEKQPFYQKMVWPLHARSREREEGREGGRELRRTTQHHQTPRAAALAAAAAAAITVTVRCRRCLLMPAYLSSARRTVLGSGS